MKTPHLISVHELRAAGALDVPPAWRKSLAAAPSERNLFSDLLGEADSDADSIPEEQAPAPDDTGGDPSSEKLP